MPSRRALGTIAAGRSSLLNLSYLSDRKPRPWLYLALVVAGLTGCTPPPAPEPDGSIVFTGMRLEDGTGRASLEDSAMLVREGRIEAIGAPADVTVPAGAEVIDLSGKTVVPGFVVSHGHLSGVRGLETGHYNEENLLRQLRLYARYGMTTVVSLGGDGPEAVSLRDAQDGTLNRARLFVAGTVVDPKSLEEVDEAVKANVDLGADFIKIRVDDNLGTTDKMPIEISTAVIQKAHEHGLKVAAHVFYLDDAKALLDADVDFIAHSVRDQPIDDDFIALMKEREVCYCPTLTREVSMFVYESVPDFFEDPFFSKEADLDVLEQLKDPERMKSVAESKAAAGYKEALEVALDNLGRAADGGLQIAFGTDTGPAGRFQGYFEHMEMEMMAGSGTQRKRHYFFRHRRSCRLSRDRGFGQARGRQLGRFRRAQRRPDRKYHPYAHHRLRLDCRKPRAVAPRRSDAARRVESRYRFARSDLLPRASPGRS